MLEGPHRQPGRDRAPRDPRVPGAGHRHGGGPLHRRRGVAPRPLRRRGRLHRPAAVEGELPQHPRALLAAAEMTGADAIHPGYGFLSENAEFAEIVPGKGHHVHRPAAGDDPAHGEQGRGARGGGEGRPAAAARRPAASSRTPRTPEALAEEIGYPVILKAAAGGGGRGMKIVRERRRRSARPSRRRATRRWPPSATAHVPRALRRGPRHIEMQIVADEHGNVVYLGERECSVQRRHQKLIEESPEPGRHPGAARAR